ncbi:MAG: DNA adenine methylase [Microcystaceae cyanobacterium]
MLANSIVYNSSNKTNVVKPILKWAGGKGQLLEKIAQYLPKELINENIDYYIEPFIGGGAVFFWIAQNFNIKEFYLSDINQEIILLYQTIQKDVDSLIEELKKIEHEYLILDEKKRKIYFLDKRKSYNDSKDIININNFNLSWARRSAEIVFLNKTCFNGLFRVNKKGYFNVPFGDYKNPTICNTNNLILASRLLQRATIQCLDFSEIQRFATPKTFVYFDPPYRPLTKTASFKSYSQFDFNDDDQKKLASFYQSLHHQGIKLMLSNSDPKNIDSNDNFFDELYSDFNINRIQANRMINSKAYKRGAISELLITNY